MSLKKMFDITNVAILINLFLSYQTQNEFTAHSFATISFHPQPPQETAENKNRMISSIFVLFWKNLTNLNPNIDFRIKKDREKYSKIRHLWAQEYLDIDLYSSQFFHLLIFPSSLFHNIYISLIFSEV